ncbi:hypothetical protein [Streptomyces sp. NPDC058086]|uniref:hypothetical protein n=1 Tax=Streptomyces sp. NPDC058086 TaxID=3346334 RepID=UPI0036E80693
MPSTTPPSAKRGAISNNASVDNAQRFFSFDAGASVFRTNTSCRFGVSGSNDKTLPVPVVGRTVAQRACGC